MIDRQKDSERESDFDACSNCRGGVISVERKLIKASRRVYGQALARTSRDDFTVGEGCAGQTRARARAAPGYSGYFAREIPASGGSDRCYGETFCSVYRLFRWIVNSLGIDVGKWFWGKRLFYLLRRDFSNRYLSLLLV